jgi:hypothetical protein
VLTPPADDDTKRPDEFALFNVSLILSLCSFHSVVRTFDG